jgi:hypothetical protein
MGGDSSATIIWACLSFFRTKFETQDTCLQSLVNSDSLNQTKLTYKIDTGLKNIITSIQKFAEVVVESKPCEMNFVRKKDKQAQMMVAEHL